jgi:molecular chaperone GrpE
MKNKDNDQVKNQPVDAEAPEVAEVINQDEPADIEDFANQEMQQVDALKQELEGLKADLEKEKKEYLFLMADFDNYRKRVLKEKSELIKNAAEKVVSGLLPIVDDFERGLQAVTDDESSKAVKEGMELIYNKLVKYLADNGVKAIDTADAPFDVDLHEAIAMVPAADEAQKGKIIDTTQKGYTLNDKVIRHAKVVVAQ